MRRSLEISQDTIDLGPEMFASADYKVISFKGGNYYSACGMTVFEDSVEGTTSSCVKPVGHLTYDHEDAFGRVLERGYNVVDMDIQSRNIAARILRLTGLDDSQIFNALNALQYAGFTLIRES